MSPPGGLLSGARLLPLLLLMVLAPASAGSGIAAGPEYWDTYVFVEPYGARTTGTAGDLPDSWGGGVRLGRVGWLAGWEGDLSAHRRSEDSGDRYGVNLDGFMKPLETAHSAFLVLAGLGADYLPDRPDEDGDDDVFFHYRYGLGYRLRVNERFGLRFDITAFRSRAGGFSGREGTLGWVIYF